MRALLCLLLILPFLTGAAFAASPNAVVFAHECKSVNPEKSGLACGTWHGRMHLHWVKSKKEIEAVQPAHYEYSRIIMRYFDLGGRHFDVTANHWKPGQMNSCSINPRRSVFCFPMQCDAQYKNCNEVKK